MQKIVFVSAMSGCPWGGSEELWSRAARALMAQGHHVAASVKGWPQDVPQLVALEHAGCTVRRRRGGDLLNRAVRFLARDTEERWLRSREPDLVVISQGQISDGLPWMQMCRSHRIPYVAIAQCNGEQFWPRDDDSRRQLAEHYDGARACYFVSARNLELARAQLASSLLNAFVVRNPFNVAFDSAPAWPSADDGFALACVARLEPHAKGQDVLFEVLRDPKWRHRPLRIGLYGD